MDNDQMDAHAEKRLFADVELIKQKQEHTDSSVNNLLSEFISHSKQTNEHLSKLALATQELVLESRTANKRIDDVEASQERHIARCEDDFRTLGKRIVSLENFKLTQETRYTNDKESRKWWSDNWYKILMVGVISIPVIVTLYKLVNK